MNIEVIFFGYAKYQQKSAGAMLSFSWTDGWLTIQTQLMTLDKKFVNDLHPKKCHQNSC